LHVKTNKLQKYINVFGESELIVIIKKARNFHSPGDIIAITNPILRFLMHTTYVDEGKLYVRRRMRVPPEDYMYFNLIADILSDTSVEILTNKSFQKELKQKLLHRRYGTMITAMNEILIAGYYKSIGIKVELHSSVEQGMADVDLVDLPFATDAKTYPNSRLYLESIVNESPDLLVKVAEKIHSQGLVIHVHVPHKTKIRDALSRLATAFEDETVGHFSDPEKVITADIMNNQYEGADFTIAVQPRNVNLFFQTSWDMGPSIEEMKSSIEKAVVQSKKLSKKAIPWIFVPRDANNHAIQMQMLRFVAKFHEFAYLNDDIFALPVYTFEIKGKQLKATFDIFQTGSNTLKINADTFYAYIKDLNASPEMYT
jgi:hypothetical protein